jgi:hypothetical protein
MSMINIFTQEQMSHAASVCGKYCSKIAALTTWDYEDEPVRCDTSIHWNNGPCSRMAPLSQDRQREGL